MGANPEIQNRLLKLDRLDRMLIRSIATDQIDDLPRQLAEFVALKKALQTDLIESSAEQVHDSRARELLQRLSTGYAFHADHLLANLEAQSQRDVPFDDLNDDEAEQLASDLFCSWASGEDYVRTLYRLGVVAIAIHAPSFLRSFLSEARNCFALQQYLATVTLCRSALEASLRDVGLRKGLIRPDASNVLPFEDKEAGIGALIVRLAHGEARERLRKLYGESSEVVHGRRRLQNGEARQIYDRTVSAINDLYKSHHM